MPVKCGVITNEPGHRLLSEQLKGIINLRIRKLRGNGSKHRSRPDLRPENCAPGSLIPAQEPGRAIPKVQRLANGRSRQFRTQ